MSISFDNSYARLPERFFGPIKLGTNSNPRLVKVNATLAHELGLDADVLKNAKYFTGSETPVGATPIAMAYAGHQFGHFVPQLGDGRALLLGEVIGLDGARYDIHLKGSGPTHFSRRGDGRAALGPVLREYIVAEAMHALGIPTTRALAIATTGDPVYRETVQPGAVLTRVARSHIRVGTFQYFAARQDVAGLRILTDYAIARYYPDALKAANPVLAFLDYVITAQAGLIAKWMGVGFIHGVMNTDNMSIAGETIDYGPCAFMDAYHPAKVFSSIDEHGRYAFANQPSIAQWNLARLAETLLPLISDDTNTAIAMATGSINAFSAQFQAEFSAILCRKIGLANDHPRDAKLGRDLLKIMAENDADFTNTFRHLADIAEGPAETSIVRSIFANASDFDAWVNEWHLHLSREQKSSQDLQTQMNAVNPAVIPRNHQVEAAIRAAVDHENFEPFERLITVLAQPFSEQPMNSPYSEPARPHERVTKTYCGT